MRYLFSLVSLCWGAQVSSQLVDPATAGVYSFVSCWSDASSSRTLRYQYTTASLGGDNNQTVGNCAIACSSRGYTFMGLEYSYQCFCDNQISSTFSGAVAFSYCSSACYGNTSEACGGPNYLSLYAVDGSAALPTFTAASTETSTTTTTTTTTTAGMETADPLSAGYNYNFIGCWSDDPGTRTLRTQLTNANAGGDNNQTVENCAAVCAAKGFVYMGLEYHYQCFCDSIISNSAATQELLSDCNTPCYGNSNEMCGGPNRLSLYEIGGSYTPIYATTTMTANPTYTGTPINLEYANPGMYRFLGCYTDAHFDVYGNQHTLQYPYLANNVYIEECAYLCHNYYPQGAYMGIWNGNNCYCGSSIQAGNVLVTSTSGYRCNVLCGDNSTEMCGGINAMSVYSTDTTLNYPADPNAAGINGVGSVISTTKTSTATTKTTSTTHSTATTTTTTTTTVAAVLESISRASASSVASASSASASRASLSSLSSAASVSHASADGVASASRSPASAALASANIVLSQSSASSARLAASIAASAASVAAASSHSVASASQKSVLSAASGSSVNAAISRSVASLAASISAASLSSVIAHNSAAAASASSVSHQHVLSSLASVASASSHPRAVASGLQSAFQASASLSRARASASVSLQSVAVASSKSVAAASLSRAQSIASASLRSVRSSLSAAQATKTQSSSAAAASLASVSSVHSKSLASASQSRASVNSVLSVKASLSIQSVHSASLSKASVQSVHLASISRASVSQASKSRASVSQASKSHASASKASTASVLSVAAAAPTAYYRYYGCSDYTMGDPPLSLHSLAPKLTLESCVHLCYNHTYMGVVMGSQCYCGNTLLTPSVPLSTCYGPPSQPLRRQQRRELRRLRRHGCFWAREAGWNLSGCDSDGEGGVTVGCRTVTGLRVGATAAAGAGT